MAVSKRLRYEILRRDNHACRYCGATAPDVTLTIDHVTPVALGGTDEPANLVTACKDCNSGKTSSSPDAPVVADVAQDALRWAQAMKLAAAAMLTDLEGREATYATFDARWKSYRAGESVVPRPDDWRATIDAFLAAGLPLPIVLDAVDRAMRNSKIPANTVFRYMCGIGWHRVREIREQAARELTGDTRTRSEQGNRAEVIKATDMLFQLSHEESTHYRRIAAAALNVPPPKEFYDSSDDLELASARVAEVDIHEHGRRGDLIRLSLEDLTDDPSMFIELARTQWAESGSPNPTDAELMETAYLIYDETETEEQYAWRDASEYLVSLDPEEADEWRARARDAAAPYEPNGIEVTLAAADMARRSRSC